MDINGRSKLYFNLYLSKLKNCWLLKENITLKFLS